MYKSNFKLNKTYLKFLINNNKYKIFYKKNYIININMLSNIYKLYNGKYFFKKHINIWSIGYKFGNLIWTKKRAKYKSKLKLKIKKKIIIQKKKNNNNNKQKKINVIYIINMYIY